MENLYFTPQSVSFFLAGTFSGLLALYLLTLPGKSAATLHLGLTFLTQALFYAFYLASVSFYHPLMAYYRWGTAAATLLGVALATRFFLTFPRDTRPTLARGVFLGQALLFLLIEIWWIRVTLDSPPAFNFAGHSYDSTTDRGGLLGLVVLCGLGGWAAAAIWRMSRATREERWTLLVMLLAFLATTLVTTTMYTLYRTGKILPATYQLTFVFFHLTGYFLIAVVFLNTTADRTTFLAKIVGISLFTLLLYFQWSAFFSLRESERLYDETRRREIELVLFRDLRPGGLAYVAGLASNGARGSLRLIDGGGATEAELAAVVFANEASLERQAQGADSQDARLYRETAGGRHFIAYRTVDPATGLAHEVGFSYRDYRERMHRAVRPLLVLSIVFLLVILIGFRLFLYRALVRPLDTLLAGMRGVNEGDLSMRLPVRVEDEIGYLTRSFNDMVARVREAREHLEQYAGRLEEKVKERTVELRRTLERVRRLKTRQDGDYFLTALLIKPLSVNGAKSETVAVDFFIRQKKRFIFKHWKDEIGGDICISQSVRLRGRPFTVFLNADAMGKSIQGAGGALVLGSVFEAIVERTVLTELTRSLFPERWLKNAFVELHTVFESFEGHMLVSLVLGLVDDATGFVYMINAEHPRAVLYRNGAAAFLEPTRIYTKLGMPIRRGTVQVHTFQLTAGDVLIAGSDGRDDIILKGADHAEEPGVAADRAEDSEFADDLHYDRLGENINEDENLFLRMVEEGQGDPARIAAAIRRRGKLIDDLSLLRVEWSGVAPPAAEIEDLKRRVRSLVNRKEFADAFAAATDLLARSPGENETLFLASYCCKKLGQLNTAADYGEALRLRSPEDTRNLQNLSEIYYRAGQREQCRDLLNRVLAAEPENERALKLQRAL